MARKINSRNRKPYIIIFWEGESEQVYMKYMRKKFHMSANLTVHRVMRYGLFLIQKMN